MFWNEESELLRGKSIYVISIKGQLLMDGILACIFCRLSVTIKNAVTSSVVN